MATRRQQRYRLDQERVRAGMEEAQELRTQGKAVEADEILRKLARERGLSEDTLLDKVPEPVPDVVTQALTAVKGGDIDRALDLFAGMDQKDAYLFTEKASVEDERLVEAMARRLDAMHQGAE